MKWEEWMEYLEAEEQDLIEAEKAINSTGQPQRRRLKGRRLVVLLAACMLMAACLAAAAAGMQRGTGPLASWFQVSDERTGELLDQLTLEPGTVAEDAGYVMEVTEAASDGKSVYAAITVTAPEGTVLDGEHYTLGMGVPWIMTDANGNGESCSGGGGIHELARPGERQAVFLLEWDFHGNLKGKRLMLEILGIEEQNAEESHLLAEGNWTLLLDVPKSRTQSRLQWTRVQAEGDTYYVYKVEITPLGIHINALKRPGGETKAQKETFFELPVTVGYQDGSTEEASGEAAGSGGLFCEKIAHYEDGRLVDPEEIKEVWLGETLLWRR